MQNKFLIILSFNLLFIYRGKNVLNQKSELQRALEKHRAMVSRKEAERNQKESFKNDPRTALQRAIEQRAKQIQLSVSTYTLNINHFFIHPSLLYAYQLLF